MFLLKFLLFTSLLLFSIEEVTGHNQPCLAGYRPMPCWIYPCPCEQIRSAELKPTTAAPAVTSTRKIPDSKPTPAAPAWPFYGVEPCRQGFRAANCSSKPCPCERHKVFPQETYPGQYPPCFEGFEPQMCFYPPCRCVPIYVPKPTTARPAVTTTRKTPINPKPTPAVPVFPFYGVEPCRFGFHATECSKKPCPCEREVWYPDETYPGEYRPCPKGFERQLCINPPCRCVPSDELNTFYRIHEYREQCSKVCKICLCFRQMRHMRLLELLLFSSILLALEASSSINVDDEEKDSSPSSDDASATTDKPVSRKCRFHPMMCHPKRDRTRVYQRTTEASLTCPPGYRRKAGKCVPIRFGPPRTRKPQHTS